MSCGYLCGQKQFLNHQPTIAAKTACCHSFWPLFFIIKNNGLHSFDKHPRGRIPAHIKITVPRSTVYYPASKEKTERFTLVYYQYFKVFCFHSPTIKSAIYPFSFQPINSDLMTDFFALKSGHVFSLRVCPSLATPILSAWRVSISKPGPGYKSKLVHRCKFERSAGTPSDRPTPLIRFRSRTIIMLDSRLTPQSSVATFPWLT